MLPRRRSEAPLRASRSGPLSGTAPGSVSRNSTPRRSSAARTVTYYTVFGPRESQSRARERASIAPIADDLCAPARMRGGEHHAVEHQAAPAFRFIALSAVSGPSAPGAISKAPP